MAVVYSDLKFLRHRRQFDALAAGRIAPPVHVRIKPINRCNHGCWYCAYRSADLALGADMNDADAIPEHKMFEIVDDLIEMGVKAVTFSGGGEPLIYKPLPRVIERLAEGGVRIGALTNGSNLKGRVADALARHATWVRVSVDAWDDESYARARGIRVGAFSRLLDNIRAFAARGSACVLGISMIIGRDNHDRVAEIAALMKDAGASHVKLSAAIVDNDADANEAYHAPLRPTVEAGIAACRALEDDGFAVIDHYAVAGARFERSYERCPFLQFLTVIGADCTVYTCQDKAYTRDGRLGSIRERRFAEFWLSDENRSRLASFDPSVSCRHSCVAHGKNLALLELLSVDEAHADFV